MAITERTKRLDPEIFELPVEKMRAGYYTDAYFNHARETLLADGRHPQVTMQVFQKKDAYLGGMDEAIAILKLCSEGWDGLKIHALYDGDRVEPYETVMTIEGDYTAFAHLETLYLGVLSRRTLITTNVVRVLEAANGKPIIFMPARHDHHRNQTGDGYAAYVAGRVVGAPIGVTTDEQASWWGGKGVGTVPHALISAYGGDTVLAATRFAEWAPPDLNVVVLVDFENDSVGTSLEVAHALGPRLWGVRLDTSENLVDKSLRDELGDFKPTGVNERLVRKVRAALDEAGFDRVRNIALSLEEGPGLGYHLLRYTNLTANVEGGFSYQLQDNTDETHTRDFFYRVAEDFNWKLGSRTSIAEKVEFFPRFNFTEYRLRAEVTLSYNIWRYVYWNMTVRDSYDTTPVANVQGNELEVHSALGVKF